MMMRMMTMLMMMVVSIIIIITVAMMMTLIVETRLEPLMMAESDNLHNLASVKNSCSWFSTLLRSPADALHQSPPAP